MYALDWRPDPEEEAFRSDLYECLKKQDFDGWRSVRLIYADWLHDRGDPREAMTRADWRVTRTTPRGWHFELPLPEPIPEHRVGRRAVLLLRGCVNAWPILSFAPRQLRANFGSWHRESGVGPNKLSAVAFRVLDRPQGMISMIYDTGFIRGGFPALWAGHMNEVLKDDAVR